MEIKKVIVVPTYTYSHPNKKLRINLLDEINLMCYFAFSELFAKSIASKLFTMLRVRAQIQLNQSDGTSTTRLNVT